MTDIKLPAGYEDWVEKKWPDVSHPDQPPMGGTYLRVIHELVEMNAAGRYVGVQGGTVYFVPPKPKPTLPDVKPGAVIRYVDTQGLACRAVRLDPTRDDEWKVFTQYDAFLGAVNHSDEDMLTDVNADGFTVELEGL